MGQYHLLVNLDKREYIYSHQLGDGLKAWEQFASGPGGVMSAAIYLMVCPTPRGGGDFDAGPNNTMMGRWHGDYVTWVGDYAEKDDFDSIVHDGVAIHPDIIYALCAKDEDDRQSQIEHSTEILADESRPEHWKDAARRILKAAEAGLWFTNITPQVRAAMEPEMEGFIEYVETDYGSIARQDPRQEDRGKAAMKPDMVIGFE